ncbi:hypothetical protein BGZ74_009169 [Mortierella antarctica]|nr:hypothetical protein BGZ74_009169 [Mortierella antarctica]
MTEGAIVFGFFFGLLAGFTFAFIKFIEWIDGLDACKDKEAPPSRTLHCGNRNDPDGSQAPSRKYSPEYGTAAWRKAQYELAAEVFGPLHAAAASDANRYDQGMPKCMQGPSVIRFHVRIPPGSATPITVSTSLCVKNPNLAEATMTRSIPLATSPTSSKKEKGQFKAAPTASSKTEKGQLKVTTAMSSTKDKNLPRATTTSVAKRLDQAMVTPTMIGKMSSEAHGKSKAVPKTNLTKLLGQSTSHSTKIEASIPPCDKLMDELANKLASLSLGDLIDQFMALASPCTIKSPWVLGLCCDISTTCHVVLINKQPCHVSNPLAYTFTGVLAYNLDLICIHDHGMEPNKSFYYVTLKLMACGIIRSSAFSTLCISCHVIAYIQSITNGMAAT